VRRAKKTAAQTLGPRQSTIMESLWADGPQTPVDLHRRLSANEDVAYTTIFTELSRLVAKRLVRKRGRTHLSVTYEAAMTREAYVSDNVAAVLGDLLAAHGSAVIHGFVDLVAEHDELEALDAARECRRSRA